MNLKKNNIKIKITVSAPGAQMVLIHSAWREISDTEMTQGAKLIQSTCSRRLLETCVTVSRSCNCPQTGCAAAIVTNRKGGGGGWGVGGGGLRRRLLDVILLLKIICLHKQHTGRWLLDNSNRMPDVLVGINRVLMKQRRSFCKEPAAKSQTKSFLSSWTGS